MSTSDDIRSVVRLAAGAYIRTAEWGVRRALGTVGLDPFGRDVRGPQHDADDPFDVVDDAPPAPAARTASASPQPGARRAPSLRERGDELLRRSADVHDDQEGHPAYERILDELLPDEARVLRLLHLQGAQPAVDVRAGTIPINAASELVAPGLTMIGAEAGCRRPERVPAYLNNLNRLGLIWFSREAVPEQSRYQVLEAQPDVVDALKAKGRARTVRRSIALTPFGEDFCARVLAGA